MRFHVALKWQDIHALAITIIALLRLQDTRRERSTVLSKGHGGSPRELSIMDENKKRTLAYVRPGGHQFQNL